jgi:hypothetical protein
MPTTNMKKAFKDLGFESANVNNNNNNGNSAFRNQKGIYQVKSYQ